MKMFDMIMLGFTTKFPSKIDKSAIHPDVKLAIPQGTSMDSAAAGAQRRMAGYGTVMIGDTSGSMTPLDKPKKKSAHSRYWEMDDDDDY